MNNPPLPIELSLIQVYKISCSCVQVLGVLFLRPLDQVGHAMLVAYLLLSIEIESRCSVIDGMSGD